LASCSFEEELDIFSSKLTRPAKPTQSSSILSSSALVSAGVLYQLVETHSMLLANYSHLIEEVLHEASHLSSDVLHPISHVLAKLCATKDSLQSSLLIFVQKHLFSATNQTQRAGWFTFSSLLFCSLSAHFLLEHFPTSLYISSLHISPGLIVATHLLAAGVLPPNDVSALVSWVLRVMKLSSGSELATVFDLLTFNLHLFPKVRCLPLLLPVLLPFFSFHPPDFVSSSRNW
jgi:hypothetical protein